MENEFLKLGIIGNPLSHSISPLLQDVAIKSAKLIGEYKKFECEKNELTEVIEYLKSNDYLGFNVTIPYKEIIIDYLDEIDENAKKIGAVNTVKIRKNKLTGYNTDIYGFLEPIKTQNFDNAVILGAGGAARAVVFGLDKLNVQDITICARNIEKANIFLNSIKDDINANINIQKINDNMNFTHTDILVNCTPCGMKGKYENILPINLENINEKMFVYDVVYNPVETKLLHFAKDKHLDCINGLDMLVFQGVKAFEIWTGRTPDIEMMKKSAYEYFL